MFSGLLLLITGILDFIFFIPDISALLFVSVLLSSHIVEQTGGNRTKEQKETIINRMALLLNFFIITFLGLIYFPFFFTIILYSTICLCLNYTQMWKNVIVYMLYTRDFMIEQKKLN